MLSTPSSSSSSPHWPSFDDWADATLIDLRHLLTQLDIQHKAGALDLDSPAWSVATPGSAELRDATPVTLRTLMAAHRLPLPAQVAELADAIDSIRLAIEGLLRHFCRSATHVEQLLSAEDTALLKEVVRAFRDAETPTLFEQLAGSILDPWSPTLLRQYPFSASLVVFQGAKAAELSQQLLKALGWYGAHPLEYSSPITTALLLEKACALDMDPDADLKGFDLHVDVYQGKSYGQINDAIEAHLGPYRFASLRSGWLAAHYPIGLKNTGVPPALAFKTSATWVRLQHGLLLAEARQSGASPQLSFQELLDYPAKTLQERSVALEKLTAACMTPPLIDWAQANGYLPDPVETGYTLEQIDEAMQCFIDQEEKLAKAVDQLCTPPVQRLEMARQALAENGIDEKRIYINRSGYSDAFLYANREAIFGRRESWEGTGYHAIDLLATGRLKAGSNDWMPPWIRGHDGHFHPVFLSDGNLQDIPAQFNSAFDQWWINSMQALDTLVTGLIRDLPIDERRAIEQGLVTLYTLRSGNRLDGSVSPGSGNFVHTPAHDDDRVARRGFVLHSRYQDQHFFHEIFPYAGLIRRHDETPLLIEASSHLQLMELPFDWNAYSTGTPLNINASSRVIFHHLKQYRHAPKHLDTRSALIASDIKRQFALGTKTRIRAQCWGQTRFDEPDPLLPFLKTWIIPLWGPVEDLIELNEQRGKTGQKVLASFSVLADVLSLVFPIAKVCGLTARFAGKATTLGLRAALPQLRKTTRAVMTGVYETLNPLAGTYDLLRLVKNIVASSGKKGVTLACKAMEHLNNPGVSLSRRITPPILDAQGAALKRRPSPAHALAHVDEQPDMMIFKDHHQRPDRPSCYLIDAQTSLPYGPVLKAKTSQNRLTLSYPASIPVIHIDDAAAVPHLDPLTPTRMIRQGFDTILDTGGVLYELKKQAQQTLLRKRGPVADDNALQLVRTAPCRLARGVNTNVCSADTVRNVGYSDVPLSTSQGREPVAWFCDLHIQVARDKQYVHGRRVWEIVSGKAQQRTKNKLSLSRYKSELSASVMGGNDLFKRIRITGGLIEGISDSREISAVVATYKSNGLKEIVTQADDKVFYSARYVDGQADIIFKRISPAEGFDANPVSDADYLALIYLGTFDANAYIRKLSVDTISADLAKLQKIIDDGGAPDIHSMINGPFEMGTTAPEAALFCLYARKAVTLQPRVAQGVWQTLSEQVSVQTRTEIADQLNRLHNSADMFNASSLLLPATTRLIEPEGKNLAFLKITSKDPANHPPKVYYAVSGYQQLSTDMPLARQVASGEAPSGWQYVSGRAIAPDNTHYINARQSRPAAGSAADLEEVVFLPDLSKPGATMGNHRLLDSEHMILNTLIKEHVDWTKVESVQLFSSRPTCPSCTLALNELKNKLPDGRFAVFEGAR